MGLAMECTRLRNYMSQHVKRLATMISHSISNRCLSFSYGTPLGDNAVTYGTRLDALAIRPNNISCGTCIQVPQLITLYCRPTVPVWCEDQVIDAKCTRPFLLV